MIRKLTSVLLACFIAGLLPMTIFAADTTSVEISVSCEAENDSDQNTAVIEPVSEDYRYTIREDTLTFTGSGTKSFVLDFSEPGNYYYKVRQSADASTSEYMDKKAHSIKVYVFWDDNGSLVATPVIYLEGERDKETGIKFSNFPTAHYRDNGRDEADDDSSHGSSQSTAQQGTVTGSVQTGDQTPVLEAFVLMLVSAVVLATAARLRRSK